jgi:PucR-like helix-turn-helix protein
VELVDLEKGPRRSRSLEEPCGAAADVNTAHYRLAKIAERTDCDLRRVSDLIEILIAARLADAAARDAAS